MPVAISGSHITLIAGLVFFLMRRAWLLWPRLALRWPAPKAAAVAALIAALVYSALAGFAVPTQRAQIMIAVEMHAVLRGRHTRPCHVLALAQQLVMLWEPMEWLAQVDHAQWTQAAPPAWTLLPAALGALVLLAPAGVPGRWVGVVLLVPLVAVTPQRPAAGEAWLTLLDVGQGLAAVIRTADHSLVFDTGPGSSESFDAGSAAVAPFLRATGVRSVDTLVVSHGDQDHVGGLRCVLKQVPVQQIMSSVPEKIASLASGVQRCRAGQRWEWDGVHFEMIYPMPELGTRGNDASCVLRVSTAGGVFLLPGDIEKRSEKALLAAIPSAWHAAVVVAPHHGSNTSSTAAFLAAVRPHYALFAVGYRNRYGFPKPAVMERYRATDTQMLDTAMQGAITLKLGAGGVSAPESYRRQALRYWHAR